MDIAHQETDKIIAKTEKLITKEYKKAHKEVSKKLDDYLARFATKDEKWQQWVASGKKTQAEYVEWKKGQILIGKRWEAMKNTLAADYANAAQISESIVNGYKPEVYALNHNYATFEVEKESMIDTSYTLYSKEAVERMHRDNPRLYHQPGDKVKRAIKSGKQAAWDKRRIQSVMTQGVLQGDSIPNLTKRLEKVTGGDHKAAIRNARTMMTGVENAGRLDAIKRANELGIPTKKQWVATLDSRTRHWHRQLDGVIEEPEEPFVNQYGKIMFPGDPTANGANLYNCRCRIRSAVKGFERDMSNLDRRYNENLGDMDYETWKETRKSISHPITKQEGIGKSVRQAWWNKYAGHGGAQAPTRHKYTAKDGQRIVDEWDDEQNRSSTRGSGHTFAEGRDISGTWERRPDQYDFEIDDVMAAQGFDGLPRVVSNKDEFNKLVLESNSGKGFVAQRAYSAPTQEILDEYRNQLYHGKWYVDCSTGGARHGQGMYCVGDFSGKITAKMKGEMDGYATMYGFDRPAYIETFTLSPDTKFVEEDILRKEMAEHNSGIMKSAYQSAIDETVADKNLVQKKIESYKKWFNVELSEDEMKTYMRGMQIKNADPSAYKGQLKKETQKVIKKYKLKDHSLVSSEFRNAEDYKKASKKTFKDIGSYGAAKGYDAINVSGRGEDAPYVVVLNRTKCIILGE